MDLRVIYIILIAVILISFLLYFKVKNRMFKFISGFVMCVSIIIGCLISINPILDKINYGLDLQGGFEVLYQVSPINKKEKLSSDMVYNTYQSLVKRVDILGVSEPEMSIEGDDKIRVKLAGIKNKEEAREVLSATASLTFRDTTDHLLMTSDVLGGNAKVTSDQSGKPAVSLSIKDKDKFYEVTSKISKKDNNVIVIWLDYDEDSDSYSSERNNCGSLNESHCLSAATVSQGFSSDVIISGNFTEEEASSLVELINSGALPTKLTEVSSRTVEASFGANSLDKTMLAGVIGIAIVILIMVLVYHFAGFVASMGVIMYTMFTFLIFYLINGVLTLPGIAAILLGIGMAVDSNVISFERIKEQLKIGKSLDVAFKIGNSSSLTSIIDANTTTLIVAIIIFIFGESSVKGFATMLIISIIVTVLVIVFFNRLILQMFVKSGVFDDKLNLFIGVKKKNIHKAEEIDIPFKKLEFVRNRKIFLTGTLIVIVIGMIITVTKGANLGVDFSGGTSVTVNLNDKVKLSSLEDEMKKLGYTIKKEEETSTDITVVIKEVLDKDDIKSLTSKLEDKYDTDTDIYTVSKIVKQELTKNAIYSILLGCIGILIYISFRFKVNYAIAAVMALVHDVLIIIMFFCIFRLEITTMFIAAILTIIGYSINDTVVTFDMIRENYKKRLEKKEMEFKSKKKEIKNAKSKNSKKLKQVVTVFTDDDLIDLVNDSVRITFFRSLLTTITTIFPVICLMILGAREIVNFNIALLVGFVAGVYSSIYISNQVWLILESRSLKKPKKDKKDDDEIEEIKVKGVNC
jgi:SecD/SecF fusion protein